MEMVGKDIHRFCSQTGLDASVFFDLTLFCYLTHNADMHLKNFSLLTNNEGEILFSPLMTWCPLNWHAFRPGGDGADPERKKEPTQADEFRHLGGATNN
jgi:hypothetical protein